MKHKNIAAALVVLTAGSVFYGTSPASAKGTEVEITFKRSYGGHERNEHMPPPPPEMHRENSAPHSYAPTRNHEHESERHGSGSRGFRDAPPPPPPPHHHHHHHHMGGRF